MAAHIIVDSVDEILDGLQELIAMEVSRLRGLMREGLEVAAVEQKVAKLSGAFAETVRTRIMIESGDNMRELSDDQLRDQMLADPSVRSVLKTLAPNTPTTQ